MAKITITIIEQFLKKVSKLPNNFSGKKELVKAEKEIKQLVKSIKKLSGGSDTSYKRAYNDFIKKSGIAVKYFNRWLATKKQYDDASALIRKYTYRLRGARRSRNQKNIKKYNKLIASAKISQRYRKAKMDKSWKSFTPKGKKAGESFIIIFKKAIDNLY